MELCGQAAIMKQKWSAFHNFYNSPAQKQALEKLPRPLNHQYPDGTRENL
jgi:hypothetical protein